MRWLGYGQIGGLVIVCGYWRCRFCGLGGLCRLRGSIIGLLFSRRGCGRSFSFSFDGCFFESFCLFLLVLLLCTASFLGLLLLQLLVLGFWSALLSLPQETFDGYITSAAKGMTTLVVLAAVASLSNDESEYIRVS